MVATVSDLVRKWDLEGHPTQSGEAFNQIHEKLQFLDRTHYAQYIPTLGSTYPDYETRLETWLANVAPELDKRILLELAPRITFFAREEFAKLYQAAFRGPITRWLIEQLSFSLTDPDLTTHVLKEAINHTWFCPITDSMQISDFSHVNHLGGIDMRPDWMSLSTFGDPAKILNYMTCPSSLKPGPLRRIVLLEDYIGSGTQMIGAVTYASGLDPSIPVLLVPLIISPAGAQKARDLTRLHRTLSFHPIIELTEADCLTNTSVAAAGSLEALAIDLARRTYTTVVGDNAAAPRPYTCFGFQETGAVVVLYSNTPANTLPIVQHRSNAWVPLFPRSAHPMIALDKNPFQELYVTDNPDPKVFVELFSDHPVKSASELFLPGNVILKGTQGSGKSMLLNLLKPQIRLAYVQARAPFPVNDCFLSAGINLTRSGALDMGQRPLSANAEQDEKLFPLYFADFINYYIVRDLLDSVVIMQEHAEAFNCLINPENLDSFARRIASEDCWFGYLSGCMDFSSLCKRIDGRISSFRAFHQFNGDLAPEIPTTKTAIGEPIARTAECLKAAATIPATTPVLIRIDQIERLYRSDVLRPSLGHQYRRIINKALGLRDMRVSYRIGTRKYAWEDDLTIYGTDDKLEHIRDFRIIDLDDILRRKEHTRTWIFPDFAEDVFRRRLRHVGYMSQAEADCIRKVFGSSAAPEEAARAYAANSTAERVLKLDESFPPPWRQVLERIFPTDPLSATLGAAWVRQRLRSARPSDAQLLNIVPILGQEPWNRPYWKKERVRQCLLQIAARTAQRFRWAGKEQILSLSSGNISIFISLCHEVWNSFLRSTRRKKLRDQRHPVRDGIEPDIQSVGIQTAGTYWYQKVTEQPKGDDRQRFIDVLGRLFRSWLLDDTAMSYPGHNGFSLTNDDLETKPPIKSFLADAVDYGDLFDSPHTTKEKDRRQRMKWYLSPILSVFFQIPETHVKEPNYVKTDKVIEWLGEAGVVLDGIAFPTTPGEKSDRQDAQHPKHRDDENDLPLFPKTQE